MVNTQKAPLETPAPILWPAHPPVYAQLPNSGLRDLAFAALATVAALLLLECGLRLAGVVFTPSLFTMEADRGYSYRPHAAAWTESNRQYDSFNALGYHDREHSLAKPPGVLRIAVVGSSFVSATQVALKDNFCSVLERTLNSSTHDNPRVEVLNFGQAAYSPVQSYYTLQKHVWQYHPDIVIFMVTNIDLLDTSRSTAFNRFPFRPFFDLDPNGRVVRDEQSRSAPPPDPTEIQAENRANDLVNRSELLLAFVNAYKKTQTKWGPEPSSTPDPYRRPDFDWVDMFTFTPPPRNGPMERNWRILASLMSQIQRDAREHSARVWVIPIGTREQVNPDPGFWRAVRKQIGVFDRYYWNRRVDTLALAYGFHSLDLSIALADYAQQYRVKLHGFPYGPPDDHWNEKGHYLAGRLIASEVLNSSPLFNNLQQAAAPAPDGLPLHSAAGPHLKTVGNTHLAPRASASHLQPS